MDFANLLSKEIAKKKAAASSSGSGSDRTSKYVTKAELERNRKQAYGEQQLAEENKRKEKFRKRQLELDTEQKLQEEYRERKKVQQNKEREKTSEGTEKETSPSVGESVAAVILRLRELKEPVTLFGETDRGREKRLERIEQRIILAQQSLKEQEEDENTDYLIIPQDIKDNQDKVYIQLRVYIKKLLKEWQVVLDSRPDDVTQKSRDILKETTKDLNILLDQLRNKSLQKDIFPSLATLMLHLQRKDYRQANETYIQLSIGNAAWPIGVIGVAIHERRALEKITGSQNAAHIMSDDKTRRWLTAVKRLITFCEGNKP